MRIVPLPPGTELADFESKATLGPPPSMTSQDCETVEIVRSEVALPSGQRVRTVKALVFISAPEIERIRENGGHFWLEFIGDSFPPVVLYPPEPTSAANETPIGHLPFDGDHVLCTSDECDLAQHTHCRCASACTEKSEGDSE